MSDQPIRNMAEFSQVSGVSRPTLSKYFNDPASVRPATRRQIEQALSRYDYRPNLFAVNLNKKKPKVIGIIVPDTSDMFFSELVRQIELRCMPHGYLVIVLSSRGDPLLEARSVETFLSLKIAGAIVAPLGQGSDRALMQSLQARIPIVFLDSRLDGDTPFVGTDNGQSVALITDYLCRTGTPPTFFDMPPVNNNAAERRAAYVETMERLRQQPEIVDVAADHDWHFEEIAHGRAIGVIDGAGFPTSTILCANDRIAVGVMAAAFQRGLKVGRESDCDLRIAGHDDQPYSRYLCPPLTTVAQDYAALGRSCVDILLDRVEQDHVGGERGAPTEIRLEAKLVMRASA